MREPILFYDVLAGFKRKKGMTESTSPEYRIFKTVTHDWDGDPMSDLRKGAPLYGLFEVHRNSKGEIYGRNEFPALIIDTYLEEAVDDPVTLFQALINAMQEGIRQPILEEPYDYADSEAMTDEAAEIFIAGCSISKESDEKL